MEPCIAGLGLTGVIMGLVWLVRKLLDWDRRWQKWARTNLWGKDEHDET